MALAHYQFTALIDSDSSGLNAVPNQAVTVNIAGSTVATIYSDLAGTSPITQPGAQTDANGNFSFYALSGGYDIVSGGRTETVYLRDTDDRLIDWPTVAAMSAYPAVIGDRGVCAERANAIFKAIDATTSPGNAPNAANIVAGDASISFQLFVGDVAYLKQFGAVGDDATDDTTVAGLWLDYIIANNIAGDSGVESDIYRIGTVTKAINSGIKIRGSGVFKANGAARTNMIKFTGAQSTVDLDEVTFDANYIVNRALEILNTGNVDTTTLGSIMLGKKLKIKNAFNALGGSAGAYGCYIQGGFTDVSFGGEIDDCESQDTTAAEAYGLVVAWSASQPDDWVRNCKILSTAKIKNVRNSNASPENSDGLQFLAPVTQNACLSVAPGAYFENCEGRAIKSQVTRNNIIAPVIYRSLYDGVADVDLQYAGGCVIGAEIHHHGRRVTSCINVTQRLSPNNSHCTVSANTLTITGAPASNTAQMVQIFGTDNTDAITNQGVTINNNKVKGTVDYFATIYGTNIVDVNVVGMNSNWVKTIGVAWLSFQKVFANRAQLSLIARDNICEDGCVGSAIAASSDLKVIIDEANIGITPFLSTPYSYTIASGVLTLVAGQKTVRVIGEGGAADDIDTITMTGYSPDELVTLYNNTGNTLTYKDGTGNLKLAGDAALSSINDTLVVRYNGTNVCEVSRSINGA